MSASTNMTAARNPDFIDRVKLYLQKAAVAVMAEAGDAAGHALRVAYAGKVLAGTASAREAAIAVMTNGTVAANELAAPDGDIEFAVDSMFDALAGVAN